MPPTEAEQARTRITMRREIFWARMILWQMFWGLGWALYVLTRPDPKPLGPVEGTAGVVVTLTILWLSAPVLRRLGVQIYLLLLMALDGIDHLLQTYLRLRAIRRRGSLGSGPTNDGSSGSTYPRPDNGSGSE